MKRKTNMKHKKTRHKNKKYRKKTVNKNKYRKGKKYRVKKHKRTKHKRRRKRHTVKKQKGGGILDTLGLGDIPQMYYKTSNAAGNFIKAYKGEKPVPSADVLKDNPAEISKFQRYKIPDITNLRLKNIQLVNNK